MSKLKSHSSVAPLMVSTRTICPPPYWIMEAILSQPLISIRDWIAHLLSERLQELKPEVTPTYALICKRRHIGWSHHEEWVAIFCCCEFVVFAYNHEIDEQSKSLIYENYNCATVKYSESGTMQHGGCCPLPGTSISDNRCSIHSLIEISGPRPLQVALGTRLIALYPL